MLVSRTTYHRGTPWIEIHPNLQHDSNEFYTHILSHIFGDVNTWFADQLFCSLRIPRNFLPGICYELHTIRRESLSIWWNSSKPSLFDEAQPYCRSSLNFIPIELLLPSSRSAISVSHSWVSQISTGGVDIGRGSEDIFAGDCGRSGDLLTNRRLLPLLERETARRVPQYNVSGQQSFSLSIVFTPSKPRFNEEDGVSLGKVDE